MVATPEPAARYLGVIRAPTDAVMRVDSVDSADSADSADSRESVDGVAAAPDAPTVWSILLVPSSEN